MPAFNNIQQLFSKLHPILVQFSGSTWEWGPEIKCALCSLQTLRKLHKRVTLSCGLWNLWILRVPWGHGMLLHGFWMLQRPWKSILPSHFKNKGLVDPEQPWIGHKENTPWRAVRGAFWVTAVIHDGLDGSDSRELFLFCLGMWYAHRVKLGIVWIFNTLSPKHSPSLVKAVGKNQCWFQHSPLPRKKAQLKSYKAAQAAQPFGTDERIQNFEVSWMAAVGNNQLQSTNLSWCHPSGTILLRQDILFFFFLRQKDTWLQPSLIFFHRGSYSLLGAEGRGWWILFCSIIAFRYLWLTVKSIREPGNWEGESCDRGWRATLGSIKIMEPSWL